MNTIDRTTLSAWQSEGYDFILVDTLTASAFESGHLPSAINLVSDNILEQAPEQLLNRSATIVVYCANATCKRAGLAAERLESLGYTQIFHYEGGKKDWIAAGLPLEACG